MKLHGTGVVLEPLTLERVPELLLAANESRLSYGFTVVPHDEQSMRAWVEAALGDARAVPFVTVSVAGGLRRLVGSTRFAALERWPGSAAEWDGAEIGWTWLAASAQRTSVNTEAKLLMLTQAFERWGARRVTLKTDARNERSRTAILRLGAKLDGVLRAHMPASDGGVRDSAFYSILAAEWPEVRARLQRRLTLSPQLLE